LICAGFGEEPHPLYAVSVLIAAWSVFVKIAQIEPVIESPGLERQKSKLWFLKKR
jgi:hypothetical protein